MYKLLIVDDELQILEGLKNTLDWKALGFGRIATAQTYEEAVNYAIEIRPDVALFDVRLGDRYGFDAINRLNEIKLPTVYVMISGHGEFEYAREAMKSGAKGYLLKPIDREELQTMVEKIIVEDLLGELPQGGIANDIDQVTMLPYKTLSKLTNKIIVMIKSEYGENISLKIVAEKFKMNSAYLGQIFFKETKMKFSEYLMIFRMQKAKELLLHTNEKISMVAKQVGYTNLNYFYTQFRDFYNHSPSTLRQEEKEEPDA